MFGLPRRREGQLKRAGAAHADEVRELQDKVAELEAALEAISATSKLALPGGAFAEAWSASDGEPDAMEDFFASGSIDLRARRWLLATH